jgi:hypothetical protein
MPIADGAISAYFESRWLQLLALSFFPLCTAILLCVFLVSIYLRCGKLTPPTIFYFILLIGVVGTISVGAVKATLSQSAEDPQFVIHSDFVACKSWRYDNAYMKVPWGYISKITKSTNLRYAQVRLNFSLVPEKLVDIPWTDWIRERQQVSCSVGWLTHDPASFRIWTDTDQLQKLAETAWHFALARNSRPSYRDLMTDGVAGRSR